jgi:hypothetical protein
VAGFGFVFYCHVMDAVVQLLGGIFFRVRNCPLTGIYLRAYPNGIFFFFFNYSSKRFFIKIKRKTKKIWRIVPKKNKKKKKLVQVNVGINIHQITKVNRTLSCVSFSPPKIQFDPSKVQFSFTELFLRYAHVFSTV